MPDKMQVLWYLRQNDGPFPWSPRGAYPENNERVRNLAEVADRAGFYGVLATGRNPFIETASLIPLTERLRFLIPIYPGSYQPSLLVQQAQTFDEASGGRLLINQVNGTDSILPQYGIFDKGDERYQISAEYWTIFKKLYAGEIREWRGKYFQFGAPPTPRTLGVDDQRLPRQFPHTPIWGSGASPAGIRHAGEVLDVYLTYLHHPDKLGAQIRAAREVAARHGRRLRVGTLANVIVRETDEAAWDHAQWLMEQTGVETIVKQIDTRLKFREFVPDGFNSLRSDDPALQARIDAFRQGRLPELRSLESYPNIWSGVGSWNAVDVLDKGWGAYLVGSATSVAERMRELQQKLGIDVFIFAGFPLTEEAEITGRLLLPLLDLDHSPPILTSASESILAKAS